MLLGLACVGNHLHCACLEGRGRGDVRDGVVVGGGRNMTPVGVMVGAMAKGWAKIQCQAPTVDGWLVGWSGKEARETRGVHL
mgnify:FL=1